jgi:hypothetical protein
LIFHQATTSATEFWQLLEDGVFQEACYETGEYLNIRTDMIKTKLTVFCKDSQNWDLVESVTQLSRNAPSTLDAAIKTELDALVRVAAPTENTLQILTSAIDIVTAADASFCCVLSSWPAGKALLANARTILDVKVSG